MGSRGAYPPPTFSGMLCPKCVHPALEASRQRRDASAPTHNDRRGALFGVLGGGVGAPVAGGPCDRREAPVAGRGERVAHVAGRGGRGAPVADAQRGSAHGGRAAPVASATVAGAQRPWQAQSTCCGLRRGRGTPVAGRGGRVALVVGMERPWRARSVRSRRRAPLEAQSARSGRVAPVAGSAAGARALWARSARGERAQAGAERQWRGGRVAPVAGEPPAGAELSWRAARAQGTRGGRGSPLAGAEGVQPLAALLRPTGALRL